MTVKLCECGCGQPAPIATQNSARNGHVKGQPMRFIRFHHYRSAEIRQKMSDGRREAGNEKLRGRKRPAEVGAKISARVKGRPNVYARKSPRDGDKIQARRRVRMLVRDGRLPSASSLPCTDCGHVWQPGEAFHGYDHYLGYAAEHHESVQPVCIPCHNARERTRKAAA